MICLSSSSPSCHRMCGNTRKVGSSRTTHWMKTKSRLNNSSQYGFCTYRDPNLLIPQVPAMHLADRGRGKWDFAELVEIDIGPPSSSSTICLARWPGNPSARLWSFASSWQISSGKMSTRSASS